MDATGDRYDENLKEGKQACADVIVRTLSAGGGFDHLVFFFSFPLIRLEP